mmetsp:Transcript_16289/g.36631  ORF Transcript_16289/g.36631 Transcript_16289/m.36631 type:complete len:316 (-) Transcript_16289:821-1768(-)
MLLQFFHRKEIIGTRAISTFKPPFVPPVHIVYIVCRLPYELQIIFGIVPIDLALQPFHGSVQTEGKVSWRHNAGVNLETMKPPSPDLRTGIAGPPSWKDQQVGDLPFVMPEIVLSAAIHQKVVGDIEIRGSIVVVDGREEVSEVSVPAGSVHNEILRHVRPRGDERRAAVGAVPLKVHGPVPGVDGTVVLGLSYPVEEQVPANDVSVAELVVQVDPRPRSIVRHVRDERRAAAQGREKGGGLLPVDPDLAKVVALDRRILRKSVDRETVRQGEPAHGGHGAVADPCEFVLRKPASLGVSREKDCVASGAEKAAAS